MSKLYSKVTIRKRMTIRRFRRKRNIWDELKRYGSDIIHSEEMEKAFEQTHHKYSTVGEHTMRVAFSSVRLCKLLDRFHIDVDVPTVVIASLSHDLGILGRYEKYSSKKECSREHPKDSVIVAKGLLEDMSLKTQDVIERHMWPAGKCKAPNSIEAVVVSVADKYNAVKDYFCGSEVNETGVKYYLCDKKDRVKSAIKRRRSVA